MYFNFSENLILLLLVWINIYKNFYLIDIDELNYIIYVFMLMIGVELDVVLVKNFIKSICYLWSIWIIFFFVDMCVYKGKIYS